MEIKFDYCEKVKNNTTSIIYRCFLDLEGQDLPNFTEHDSLYLNDDSGSSFLEVNLKVDPYYSKENKNIIKYRIQDKGEYERIKKIIEGSNHCFLIKYKTPESSQYTTDSLKFDGIIKYSTGIQLQTFKPSYSIKEDIKKMN